MQTVITIHRARARRERMITILIRGEGMAPEKFVIDVDETDVDCIMKVVYNAIRNHGIKCDMRDEFL